MPFLTEHIKKSWVEAFPGDQVTISADHRDVQIVEKDGVLFSVRTEHLSDDPITGKIKSVIQDSEIVKPKPRWQKKQTVVTQSLFN